MYVVFALVAAFGYGISDFLAGLASRRSPASQVAAVGQLAALVVTAGFALTTGARPSTSGLLWGSVAGVGLAVGSAALYKGLADGSMSVVAPVSALAGAGLPVIVGALRDEPFNFTAITGMVVGLPAIVLVATTAADGRLYGVDLRDVGYGLLAGIGFGLMFVAYGAAAGAGMWPVMFSLAVSFVILTVLAWFSTGAVRPRGLPMPLAAGAAAGLASATFRLGVAGGSLALTSVLASLYPAITVLLAAIVLRERIGRIRAVGLALTLLSVSLIAY